MRFWIFLWVATLLPLCAQAETPVLMQTAGSSDLEVKLEQGDSLPLEGRAGEGGGKLGKQGAEREPSPPISLSMPPQGGGNGTPRSELPAIGTTVVTIESGDRLTLSDGRTVRLEGIKAPVKGQEAWLRQSTETLRSLTANQPLSLENASLDRYGRTEADLYVPSAKGQRINLQTEMLRTGMGFLYPPVTNAAPLQAMQKAEAEARQAKRGLWADPAYADLAPDKAAEASGSFAFISGKVLNVTRAKSGVYLNFSEDWHTGFSAVIESHDLKTFRKADLDPADYENKTVRLRGWVKRKGGTVMTLTDPAQIEILRNP